MGKKRILVACGTGIATSTVVANKIKNILKDKGLDVEVQQCKVAEVDFKSDRYDLIVTTTPYKNTKNDTPAIVAVSFLTGIGIDKDIDKIISIIEDK